MYLQLDYLCDFSVCHPLAKGSVIEVYLCCALEENLFSNIYSLCIL